ncbi:MAG TPA: hypothetical protein DEP66_02805, partial [Acidimicrobiaceae bacterium]|nr:hypothetical protein [Acidimicrobiaceae bacterium]
GADSAGAEYGHHLRPVGDDALAGAVRDAAGVFRPADSAGVFDGSDAAFERTRLEPLGDGAVGVEIDGDVVAGFPTPSRKLELYSETLADWGWPEYATPTWIPSHVHHESLDLAGDERILVPTFRIPTLIHTRSANAKWLTEISHRHPLWIHPSDAEQLGIDVGGLVRVRTAAGHFVIPAWRTQGIRPGVVAASHHMGRWRLDGAGGAGGAGRDSGDAGQADAAWAAGAVTLQRDGTVWRLRR